jgi:hypothetical protein
MCETASNLAPGVLRHARPCATTRDHARPHATMRDHARPCARSPRALAEFAEFTEEGLYQVRCPTAKAGGLAASWRTNRYPRLPNRQPAGSTQQTFSWAADSLPNLSDRAIGKCEPAPWPTRPGAAALSQESLLPHQVTIGKESGASSPCLKAGIVAPRHR